MILVFLVILIVALIIANILISFIKPRRSERAFLNPTETEEPEVIDKVNYLHENTTLMRGSLTATNKKLDMLNERMNSLEKVVMKIVEEKINGTQRKQLNPGKDEEENE